MKKKLLFGMLIICYLLLVSPIFGQQASSVALLDDSLKEKVKQLQQDIASKAANIKLEVSNKIQNKALFGQIVTLEDKKLTLLTKKANRTILINEYTDYRLAENLNSKKSLPITLKDLAVSDSIAALGDIDDQNRLTAKKIIKYKKVPTHTSFALWGEIQLFTNSVLKVLTKDNNISQLSISADTIFKKGGEEATLADLQIGKRVVGVTESSQSAIALLVYLPTEASSASKLKIASQSATPAASPKKQ